MATTRTPQDLPSGARELLALARRDKPAALNALAGLTLDLQVALVCVVLMLANRWIARRSLAGEGDES